MRKVMVSEYMRDEKLKTWTPQGKGTAFFHAFSIHSNEGDIYPVAIVEFEDGTVGHYPLKLIRFLD